MDIYQNDRYAKDFPLNLLNVESHFSHQLYLNLLIVFSSRIEPKAFRELLYPFAGLIRSKSTNPIWPVLYEDQPYVSPYIEAKINRFNNRLIVVDRYKKMESPNDLKTKLANDLLRFQQKLDNTTNKTLQIYDAFLRIVHKDNLNQLKAHENNRRILITEMIYSLIDTNENLIKFCYGEVEHMSEEQIIEYIKYFTLTHLDKTGKELNLSLMKYHYRKRYNAIMEMKNKIVESILAQIEKLND